MNWLSVGTGKGAFTSVRIQGCLGASANRDHQFFNVLSNLLKCCLVWDPMGYLWEVHVWMHYIYTIHYIHCVLYMHKGKGWTVLNLSTRVKDLAKCDSHHFLWEISKAQCQGNHVLNFKGAHAYAWVKCAHNWSVHVLKKYAPAHDQLKYIHAQLKCAHAQRNRIYAQLKCAHAQLQCTHD